MERMDKNETRLMENGRRHKLRLPPKLAPMGVVYYFRKLHIRLIEYRLCEAFPNGYVYSNGQFGIKNQKLLTL